MITKIAIVGGGAAGIMAAATILENSKDTKIDLFEKNNQLGVKVSISGGGRCNVTTGITDKHLLLSKYYRGSKFLAPSMAAFPPDKAFKWFEDHGVPLKVESDLRVFPRSDNGTDIVDMFVALFNRYKDRISIHFLEGILDIDYLDGKGFKLFTKKGEYSFDKVILTTGGNAYSHTGSTGDGYAFAKKLGHSITPLGPSLNSFEVLEDWCKDLKGISFQRAKIEVELSSKEKKVVLGPTLFTHFGVSGPAVFALASHVAFEEIKKDSPIVIHVTPDANSTFDDLNASLTRSVAVNGGKFVINVLADYVPYRLAEKILELCNIEGDKKSAEISKEERKEIVHFLTGKLSVTLVSRRQGDEFVTAGGVSTSEVESKSMRSKFNPNLFFAGEVLDIDGLTGGFNLQAAWATGRCAGMGVLSRFAFKE